jgi:hypothetical protein
MIPTTNDPIMEEQETGHVSGLEGKNSGMFRKNSNFADGEKESLEDNEARPLRKTPPTDNFNRSSS